MLCGQDSLVERWCYPSCACVKIMIPVGCVSSWLLCIEYRHVHLLDFHFHATRLNALSRDIVLLKAWWCSSSNYPEDSAGLWWWCHEQNSDQVVVQPFQTWLQLSGEWVMLRQDTHQLKWGANWEGLAHSHGRSSGVTTGEIDQKVRIRAGTVNSSLMEDLCNSPTDTRPHNPSFLGQRCWVARRNYGKMAELLGEVCELSMGILWRWLNKICKLNLYIFF